MLERVWSPLDFRGASSIPHSPLRQAHTCFRTFFLDAGIASIGAGLNPGVEHEHELLSSATLVVSQALSICQARLMSHAESNLAVLTLWILFTFKLMSDKHVLSNVAMTMSKP